MFVIVCWCWKKTIVDKRCVLLLHYVFLFWLWQPTIVFVICCTFGNQLLGCMCPYELWHANHTDCLFEFWSCFAFCSLHNETCMANCIRVQYCTSIPDDFAIFSKSNVNRLDPHFSWGCPPTTSSNNDWNHPNVVMNFQAWLTDNHGWISCQTSTKKGKQTNNSCQKHLYSHSGPAKTSKAPPKIAPQFTR